MTPAHIQGSVHARTLALEKDCFFSSGDFHILFLNQVSKMNDAKFLNILKNIQCRFFSYEINNTIICQNGISVD